MSAMNAPSWLTLKRFNDGLSIVILLFAVYIFMLPLWPKVSWWAEHSAPVISTPVKRSVSVNKDTIPSEDRLVIPSIAMDEPINAGPTLRELRKGVWLRPNGSTPGRESNTVMVGHRFTYTDPRGVFYFLDKVKVGDQIVVDWKQHAYEYRVKSIAEVTPESAGVEAPSKDSRLTLYTCTPLWNLKHRLVVTAELVRTI
jgi:LPXTG-site transpeptidase (sortase) family protein